MSAPFPQSRLTAAFERRVAHALDASVPAGAPVVVACSGGPDSTAALVATARVRGPGATVTAAYFDHGMRPRADIEADRVAVEALAAALTVEVVVGAVGDVTLTSEARAREARYSWLAAACVEAGASHCVTGHTLDDQAETVLLRLTRGSGLAGVAGMAGDADWPVPAAPNLRVVRPLLAVRRLEVVAYLGALGIAPRFDATNELVTFHRNRVRHRVLPELRAVNPRVDEALVRFGSLARRDNEALDVWARREFGAMATVGRGCVALDRRALRALLPAVAARVLLLAARDLELRPDAEQVETMLRLARRRGAKLSLAGGTFEVAADTVVLSRTSEDSGGD